MTTTTLPVTDDRLLLDKHLDPDDGLIVDRGLAQALGLNASIVLRQIRYWLTLNEKTKREKHLRDGVWWTYNTYEDWQRENFDFMSYDTVRRTLLHLVGLGLLMEGNYNERRYDKTKWYTINYGAFYAFMRLWYHHKQPRQAGGAKNPAYKAFLEDWGMHKEHYKGFASCKQRPQVADSVRNLPSPIPETTETTEKEKDSAPPQMPKTASRKPTPPKVAIPFDEEPTSVKADYQDVPYDSRFGIIQAWCSNLKKQPIGVFNEKTKDGRDNHMAAAEIVRAGYTEEDVAAFTRWTQVDEWWRKKTVSLQAVKRNLHTFKANQEMQAQSKPLYVTAPPPRESDMTPEERLAAVREAKRKLHEHRLAAAKEKSA